MLSSSERLKRLQQGISMGIGLPKEWKRIFPELSSDSTERVRLESHVTGIRTVLCVESLALTGILNREMNFRGIK